MQRRQGLAALLAVCAAPVAAGRRIEVAVGERLDRAVAAARDGDIVELEPGDHRGQVAVVTQQRLTLRGAGGRAVLHAEGAHAEGKALLVVRGGEVQVEALGFRGTRVPSGNGAGIRFERGRLSLRDCHFHDNEMGLLSANVPDAELRIDDCEFGDAPRTPGRLQHLLYVGTMRHLRLRGSRFSAGWIGHLVKSRARVNEILCNHIADGERGEASYEIDLPNGGEARVIGNLITQGPRPQNHALLAYGAEGPMHPRCTLEVMHNRFVNEAAEPASFVRVWPEQLPPNLALRIAHNRFHGAAVDGSWGRIEDDNVLLPLGDHPTGPPPCPA